MEWWFEGGTHSSCDDPVRFLYYKQWRKVMKELLGTVKCCEPWDYPCFVHVSPLFVPTIKVSREWTRVDHDILVWLLERQYLHKSYYLAPNAGFRSN